VASFYLIDGHAQIFRSYYAPFRELTGPDGAPIKAVYMFAQMLVGLTADRKPDYLAMVIDAAGDAGLKRTELYPDYKANRKPAPDDFHPQEQRIIQMVRDSGVPVLHLPGFEADDVLATLARRLEAQGHDVILVSKDKDLRQVLSPNVRMYDVGADTFLTVERLAAEFGCTPAEWLEMQCLMGDSTDNIPGVGKVGEKTALELVRQFGTADTAVQRAAEIKKPALKANLAAFAPNLPLTRALVTLHTDLDIPGFSVDACRFHTLATEGFLAHLKQLGFSTLLKRLAATPLNLPPSPANPSATSSAQPTSLFGESLPPTPTSDIRHPTSATPTDLATTESCDYQLIDTPDLLANFVSQLRAQPAFAFDSETDALGAMYSNPIGFSFSWQPGQGFYLPVQGPLGCKVLDLAAVVAAMRGPLENPAIAKYGHNIKYDLLVLRNCGIHVRGVALDTMVAAFILDAGRMTFGIDKLAEQLLGIRKVPTSDLIGSGTKQISMAVVDTARVARYAAEDADVCLRLAHKLSPQLDAIPELRKLADTIETPLLDILTDMEEAGIAVDAAVLREQSDVLATRIEALRGKITEAAGGIRFNPDSPKQLAEVLFDKLNLRKLKKTKTGYSTDVEVLDQLAADHPVPGLILEYRSLVKLKNTYLDNLTDHLSPKTGRIHTSFSPVGAATGRLSSSDPNLQNIPIRTDEGRRIRLAFVPSSPDKLLLAADYSQIELRVLAHFTREPALLKAFEADEDIHKAVAAEVYNVPLEQVTREQRGSAKTINFGIIYGVTAFGLSRRIEGLSVSAADKLINDYNARFPSIQRFLQECVEQARSLGYVTTIMGRRRPLPDIKAPVASTRNAAERMAINSVVQGSAADLIKIAMLNVTKRLRAENSRARMLLQVHDELVFETPAGDVEADARLIREEMTGAMTLAVPLKVEVGWGKNWGEVK
jgi:DNA polymerase I